MSPSVISLIGILLGMVVLVYLAFKGYNVIVVSVIAALVVAVFAGTEILPLITDSYMTKFADFAQKNFMIFLLSAIFGKLMGDSGAADSIAYSMLRLVNHVHSQRAKQLVGGLMITAIVALACGIVVCLVLYGLVLRRLDNLKATLAAGATNSISTIGTTCAVVGFGGVVAAVSGYQLILDSLTSIPGPAIFKLIIAVNVAAGLTGSSSGGLSIALENMKGYFLDLGLSPNVIHRIGAMSSGGLDSMPHVSGFVNNLQVCRLNHRQSYPSYAMVCLVIPIVTTCLCAVLIQIGILPSM